MIDQEKADVYEQLAHLGCRIFLVGAFTLAFFIVLGFILWKPNVYLVAVDAVLAPTTFVMTKFFFPSRSARKRRAKPKPAAPAADDANSDS